MKAIPYITFNGDCEQAITFYQSVLSGKLDIMRYRDIPSGGGMSPGDDWKDKVMHASLTFADGTRLYFSDAWQASPAKVGDNIAVHLQADGEAQAYELVKKLGEGGRTTMAADRTFWGSVYGSVVDKFGVPWGIEFELPRQE